jgi:xanthine dehydrogenase accessory factor
MDESLYPLDTLRATERRAALGTLVAAKGTTPKKEGAKVWVGESGRIHGSVTIGGCVDARVVQEAEAVLASRSPRLISLSLGDEDAWEIGLTCGGAVDVLVEPVDLAAEDDPVVASYDRVRAESERGRPAVVVARLDGRRGRLVVLESGETEGTLGDPALDAAAAVRAAELLRSGVSRVEAVPGSDGDVSLFFEHHGPPGTLVVVGATQVAMTLCTLARELGFRTIVIDGRERLATRERFPSADELRIGMPSELVAAVPASPGIAFVLVAHDYKYELPVLRQVLRSDAGYVGMLGSSRRGAAVKALLVEEGFTAEELARIHTPIGVDIGAESAAEIALSILAEVVAAWRGAGVPARTGVPAAAGRGREGRVTR